MTLINSNKQIIKFTCAAEDDGVLLVDTVAKNSSLSKSLIKKLMVNGSVFQCFKGRKRKNARKAKNTVKSGDMIECYYDPSIDLDQEFQFNVIYENQNYGIYHKPSGAMTEGTNFGDKTSLFRHVEKRKRYAYLVNRLDRETEGLVVVAYNSKTQNLLQQMWRDGVVKKYQGIVLGKISGSGVLDKMINNKVSKTTYTCTETVNNHTHVEIELATERKNQIRIHFADMGNPIIGDPIYGEHNKNRKGLQLISYSLEFTDPQSSKEIKAVLPKERLLF